MAAPEWLTILSAMAAAASAGFAAWQIGQARQTATTENRAYVQIIGACAKNWDSARPGIVFVLVNHGRTPAIRVKAFCRLSVGQGLPRFSADGLVDVGSEMQLWPATPSDFTFFLDQDLDEPDRERLKFGSADQRRLWANVVVTYRDVFGSDRQTSLVISLYETDPDQDGKRTWRFEPGALTPPPT